MAQSGFTPISTYYTTTASAAPTAGNLVNGELAINITDGKLFYKDNAGVVQTIAGKSGAGVAGGSNTQVQYNSSGSLAGSANMTFNGTTLTATNDASISGLTVGKGGGAVSTNTVVGNGAGNGNSTGSQNTIMGYQAGYNNTTGPQNTFVGYTAGYSSTGGYNSALGYQAGYAITSGTSNTALGRYSMASSAGVTGTSNTGVGDSALQYVTSGYNNVAVGYASLNSNTSGYNTVAIGLQAGLAHTTGNASTFVGWAAGAGVTTGVNNICIGAQAGNTTTPITTGAQNIHIGVATIASNSTSSYENVIGFNITGKGASTTYIANSCYQGNNSATWSITSDARLKKNIVDNTTGLSAITAIQVRNFEYRTKDEVTDLPVSSAIDIQGVQLGAIAQELQAILPDCVKTESTGVMSVDATNLTWYLINAVKELKAEIDQLKAK